MKRSLCLMLLLNLSLAAWAQISYGVKAGFVLSAANAPESTGGVRHAAKPGIQAGFAAEGKLSKDLSILTGLLYTQKGYVEKYGSPATTIFSSTFDRRISYVEVPVDLLLTVHRNKNGSAFLGTGPVPAVGISDKMKYELNFSGRPPDAGATRAGFGESKGYKRFDFGWNVTGGIRCKKIVLTADYTLGLTSITGSGYGQTPVKNRTAVISLAYFLSERR